LGTKCETREIAAEETKFDLIKLAERSEHSAPKYTAPSSKYSAIECKAASTGLIGQSTSPNDLFSGPIHEDKLIV